MKKNHKVHMQRSRALVDRLGNDYEPPRKGSWIRGSTVSEIKDSVVKILVTEYDYLLEDAETAVDVSMGQDPEMWNEKSDAKDLANYLASDDGDE
jgi:hypothetical protein